MRHALLPRVAQSGHASACAVGTFLATTALPSTHTRRREGLDLEVLACGQNVSSCASAAILLLLAVRGAVEELAKLAAALAARDGRALAQIALIADRCLARADAHLLMMTEGNRGEAVVILHSMIVLYRGEALKFWVFIHKGLRLRLFHLFNQL